MNGTVSRALVVATLLAAQLAASPARAQLDLPGFEVTRGSDDPEAISMVKAYESLVRGRMLGDEERAIRFLDRDVRLDRDSAELLYAYALEGWRELVAMQMNAATHICADRQQIDSKAELAERIIEAREVEDGLRLQIYQGALALLDEKNSERLSRYVARSRSEVTTSSYDIEQSITESQDSLRTMLSRVCSHVPD